MPPEGAGDTGRHREPNLTTGSLWYILDVLDEREEGAAMGLRAAAAAAKASQDELDRIQYEAMKRAHAEAAERAVLEALGVAGRCIETSDREPVATKSKVEGWGNGAVVLIEDEDDGLVVKLYLHVNDLADRRGRTVWECIEAPPRVLTTISVQSINNRCPRLSGMESTVASMADLGRVLAKHEELLLQEEKDRRARLAGSGRR
jgi:hypothetical protein